MNCACCHMKLFDSDAEKELFPGSDMSFCYACRKKITPFLEEQNTYPTHAAHLKARRRELALAGVTPAGLSALSSYCAYLDRTGASALRRATMQEERADSTTLPSELRDETLELNERIETLTARLHLAFALAGVGVAVGLVGLVTALVALLIS